MSCLFSNFALVLVVLFDLNLVSLFLWFLFFHYILVLCFLILIYSNKMWLLCHFCFEQDLNVVIDMLCLDTLLLNICFTMLYVTVWCNFAVYSGSCLTYRQCCILISNTLYHEAFFEDVVWLSLVVKERSGFNPCSTCTLTWLFNDAVLSDTVMV